MRPRRTAVAVAGGLLAVLVLGVPGHAAPPAGPSLTVDVTAGRHAINPDIYGMNFADTALATELGLTADRWGGNSTSRYNYKSGMTNTGSDWYFENVVPDTGLGAFVKHDLAHHTQPVVTVPMTGWVAKASPTSHPYACGFKVSQYGAQESTDPWDADCGNGVSSSGGDLTGNDPHDTSVAAGAPFVTGMVTHLVGLFGKANAGGVKTYELDNEPALWNSTHRDVHPSAVTYDELWQRSMQAAAAVKAGDPTASVAGPGDWGWCAYFFSPADPGGCGPGADRKAHGGLPMAAYYLKKFAAYDQQHHVRLLDVFDEHFYPQENGVALADAGDATTQALRLRSTRALWDPTYQDESWTSDLGLGPVKLIPRMRQWRNSYYPGTKLSISEYNWGGLESVNGALAQADCLGIFGRERLDRALLWAPPTADQPGAFAFRMYRNYDGKGHRFGSMGVRATSSDQSKLAVFASVRPSDGATTVMIVNKSTTALTSPLNLTGVHATTARVYTYSAANTAAIVHHASVAFAGGTVQRTYPASSITLLVLPKS